MESRFRVILLLLPSAALLLSSCTFPSWRDQVLRDVTEGRWKAIDAEIPPSAPSSRIIEFYDAGGRHVGYGVFRGESADFYNADGSRAGYGRGGR